MKTAIRLLGLLAAAFFTGSTLAQTLACNPSAPRTDPGVGFTAFGAAEQLLARGGQSGAAWEWAIGTDTGGSAKTQGSLDWSSGKAYGWTLAYSGTGATVETRDGGALVLSLSYASGMDRGNALQLQVSTTSSIGADTTMSAAAASIIGHAVSGTLSQTGNNQDSAQTLYFYYPPMSRGFTATGTVSLTYASLPSGSRVQFTVKAGNVPCNNAAPTVSLTAPAAESLHQAGSTITLSADAQDSDGTIAQVEFLANGTLIGTDTTSPYSIPWANVTAGSYSLTARATDNAGDQTASSAVSIVVNAQPTVSITSPASGTVVQAPGTVNLVASASDADGSITKVEFYRDGSLISSDTASPYEASVSGLPAGTYSFTAVATDDRGGVTTSAAVSAVVNAPPTVSISSPANNATFNAPANISISASAQDADGTISRVELYANNTLIATLTGAPYSFTWTNVAAGTYALSAKAIDNHNAETTSATVSVTVRVASTLYFIHVDHLDTPRLVANDQQQTVWRWDQQELFGVNVPDENPSGLGTFDLPLRLPGQHFDKETNLHYNYFRDYDPSLGSYKQSDPIGLRGGINTYAYAHSDPMRFSDPSGLAVWLCIRSVSFRFGNHSYFYDDKAKQCCGSPGWNADNPLQGCPDRGRGPGVDSCTLISSNDDDANRLFKCCQQKANPFTYFPIINDCQNITDDCIREIGMAPPQTPGTGRWMRCDTCWRR